MKEVYLHSPENLIVDKLWYYSLSQQTKHLHNIAAITLILGGELDQAHIRRWAVSKGVNASWDEILSQIVARNR
jgi:hypothetical protein